MSRRWTALALSATIAFAFLLRVWHLASRSIWFDEAFSWTLCSEFGPLEIIRRTGEDVHPPFYYVVLWGWIRAVGDSLWAMRFLSVLCGTLTVWMAYHAGKEAFRVSARSPKDEEQAQAGELVGLVFAMLVASSAFQIHWSGEVRMYALLSLLFLLTVYFGLRALNYPHASTRPLVGFTICSTLMLYTHNYGLFSFVAIGVSLVVLAWWRERQEKAFCNSRILRRIMIAGSIAGLLFVPWLPSLMHQRSQVVGNYWISPFSLTQLAIAWDGVIFPENSYGQWQKSRGEIALVITALILIALQVRARAVDVLLLMLTMIPAVLAIGISMASSSIIAYRLFVLIHLSALMAVARGLQKWLDPIGALALGVVLTADGLWIHSEFLSQLDLANRRGPRGAMEWLDSVRSSEDSVYVLHSCVYFSLRYHASDRDRIILCTPAENIVHYTGRPILREKERHDLSALTEDVNKGRRVWVVDCTGYSAGYRRPFLPEVLRFRSDKKFVSPYSFEGTVSVTEYTLSDQPLVQSEDPEETARD
ncbi:MAG: glycosyltransferase family 39 protein [Planctomycetia bacterium]